MTIPVPFTETLSETWLLERTYHAQLLNGSELSAFDLTQAMKQMVEFSAPFSAWREIAPEDAAVAYHQGTPILLYGEHSWEHPKNATGAWGANKQMRILIFGSALEQPAAVSGTDTAVCYLDLHRGKASSASWDRWFSSDPDTVFTVNAPRTITFLRPSLPFPSTTHYTVIASDGHVSEYPGRAEAIQGFQIMSKQERSKRNSFSTLFPQFCYYHEVTCPDGVYRLEFFGSRMDEPGYAAKEATSVK